MEEVGSIEPGFPLENGSTPSSASPTSFNRDEREEDQSAHEENEYEPSEIVQQMASPSTTKINSDTTPLNNGGNRTTEIRRQIHIQSEQKRRAQIKCGFEELRNELPVCVNKKMSKVTLLHRSKYNKVIMPLHNGLTGAYFDSGPTHPASQINTNDHFDRGGTSCTRKRTAQAITTVGFTKAGHG
jgi:hypothetical protein